MDLHNIPDYEKPRQIRDEIPTLNRFGFMKFEWDGFCKEFVDYAKKNNNMPVLEIGPAYGWVTHRALERDIEIIALDISTRHLEILLKEAPRAKLDKLYLYPGSFPDEVEFPEESLSAVLASRILHFLRGNEIEAGLDKIYRWLKKGGKLFCSNCSIYHYTVKEKMLALFKEREKNGDKWPGTVVSEQGFETGIEDFFHPFDISVFERVLPEHGFKIDKIKLFDYPSDIYSENNEGHVGFIATKI